MTYKDALQVLQRMEPGSDEERAAIGKAIRAVEIAINANKKSNECDKRRRKNNPEECRAKRRAYYMANRERIIANDEQSKKRRYMTEEGKTMQADRILKRFSYYAEGLKADTGIDIYEC